ncbi:Malolactic regulator [Lacticaseibacillus rhamnosus]|nr:Malolactic regulator [Lacticaseibacillus rhamnosus]AXI95891.1 Malolactic regulator [Lacticaseibacillus rhamnosus GG]ART97336.1 Malolactic regulator [Lacticaseibacillus rhamnosus]AZZ24562.1 Malolactic regulator [Lacticaseibacillus rhamnosus]PCL29207.1 Malolactic regulator [Lacticaseibacillus rhamnosus]
MTRSPAQESACKDLERNVQERGITQVLLYAHNALPGAEACT